MCRRAGRPVRRHASLSARALLVVGLAGLAITRVQGDYVMGSAEANASLAKIARARRLWQQETTTAAKAATLFDMGAEAEDLTTMINQEIGSHRAALRAILRDTATIHPLDDEMSCEIAYIQAVSTLDLSRLVAASDAATLRTGAVSRLERISRTCSTTPEGTLARRELQRLATRVPK